MKIVSTTLREANAFVSRHHRHHSVVKIQRFSVGVADQELRGVAICGNPRARGFDSKTTIEIYRVCTDGAKNACSMLYGACRRAARALGFIRCVTYTRIEEPGTSLVAAGFQFDGVVKGESWDRAGRPRSDKTEIVDRKRWMAVLV